MRVRRAHERGLTQTAWLSSHHTFSFGEYFDPNQMGFRSLRVINDDWVAPARGFGMHGHKDMEIITLVLEGELEHQDSLGNRGVLRPGEVQVMSAGKGIRHSEVNPSPDRPSHFLQIWIEPRHKGIEPRYAQRQFPLSECRDAWCRIAGSHDEGDGAFLIHQDVQVLYGAITRKGQLSLHVGSAGAAWVHIIAGDVRCGSLALKGGDALALDTEQEISITGQAPRSEVIAFLF